MRNVSLYRITSEVCRGQFKFIPASDGPVTPGPQKPNDRVCTPCTGGEAFISRKGGGGKHGVSKAVLPAASQARRRETGASGDCMHGRHLLFIVDDQGLASRRSHGPNKSSAFIQSECHKGSSLSQAICCSPSSAGPP
jgi:hypothetical protein